MARDATRAEVIRCLDTAHVCSLSSVHSSTLDYWVRTRLVSPSLRKQPGKRRTRLWSVEDLVIVRTIHELRRAGCTLQRVRAAKKYLLDHGSDLSSSTVLLWDGADLRHVDEWGQVTSVLAQPGQGVFHLVALPIGDWKREGTEVASFIRTDRVKLGTPCDTEEDAREAI